MENLAENPLMWGALGGLLRPLTLSMRSRGVGANGVSLAWGWAALEGAFATWVYNWWTSTNPSIPMAILFGWLGAYLFGAVNLDVTGGVPQVGLTIPPVV